MGTENARPTDYTSPLFLLLSTWRTKDPTVARFSAAVHSPFFPAFFFRFLQHNFGPRKWGRAEKWTDEVGKWVSAPFLCPTCRSGGMGECGEVGNVRGDGSRRCGRRETPKHGSPGALWKGSGAVSRGYPPVILPCPSARSAYPARPAFLRPAAAQEAYEVQPFFPHHPRNCRKRNADSHEPDIADCKAVNRLCNVLFLEESHT